MAPAMKGMKGKAVTAMTKTEMLAALESKSSVKKSDCKKVLDGLAEVGAKEVKSKGKFTIPGLVMVKTRVKPATKAGKRDVWQGGSGQGEASEDRGEGPRRGRLEEDYLSLIACHRWASSEFSDCLRRVGCRAGLLTAAYFSSSPRNKKK